MISTEFRNKEKKIIELYSQKKFKDAYSIIEEMIKKYPAKAGVLYNYAYSVKNLTGDTDGALALMEEAAEKGYWADPKQLVEDPDLQNLRHNPRFKEILNRYSNLAAEGRKNQKPILKILEPSNDAANSSEPLPLVIALHGNNQSAEDAIEDWKFMTEKGWIVALPQSSQVSMPDAYVWNDFSMAIPEIKAHYDAIRKKYKIDEDRLIIAGFSMGGALSAKLCFEQIIPCRRFILMGPYLKNPSELESAVRSFSNRKGKGYILVGENDSECIGGAKELFDMLRDNGTECVIDIIPGLAHEYPDNFQEMVGRNLEFLLGDSP